MHSAAEILAILDEAADQYTFPALDHGYFYLAATRLSLFRSREDWALVFELFGFNPRVGVPELLVTTFASALRDRKPPPIGYDDEEQRNYLLLNRHTELRSFRLVELGPWFDPDWVSGLVTADANVEVEIRGRKIPLPARAEYSAHGIELREPDRARICELCRFLAARERELVLATPTERRVNVLPELRQLMVLDDWHHPKDQPPSRVESFRQLAHVLATSDTTRYQPRLQPNTHWKNWPAGGTL